MSFVIIALVIEACWNGRLDDFLQETLFGPLELHSTSTGLGPNCTAASERWTVDQHGTRRPVQVPDYTATGSEAAGLGAYTTAEDLDTFFSSVIDASHDIESVLQDCERLALYREQMGRRCIVLYPTWSGNDAERSSHRFFVAKWPAISYRALHYLPRRTGQYIGIRKMVKINDSDKRLILSHSISRGHLLELGFLTSYKWAEAQTGEHIFR
ncbi:uncharacterized protein M421DRAFT_380667 [Didymella exigua CBS 183.55]|uniref:Uncharacterized protein n=1 Tax=Didymella exigua CBS 183.55 TaxID=1150837 RepID=A0A6A5RS65_9PLEO|nr:uncharacterized protein M421DRAFT_380667 [Didymella exigua CBS 183.55]KAF1929914.1 hypothetical protein M421DRAFT_380667 [Didymella exigua CBS 183.55]